MLFTRKKNFHSPNDQRRCELRHFIHFQSNKVRKMCKKAERLFIKNVFCLSLYISRNSLIHYGFFCWTGCFIFFFYLSNSKGKQNHFPCTFFLNLPLLIHIVRSAMKQLNRKSETPTLTKIEKKSFYMCFSSSHHSYHYAYAYSPSRIINSKPMLFVVVSGNWQRTYISRSAYLSENSHGIFSSCTNSHVSIGT